MHRNQRLAVALRRQMAKLCLSTATGALIAAGWAVPVLAQDITASMSGRILRPDGSPAAGVQVEITHVRSGTRSTTTVNDAGRFTAQGLRPGGPYTVRFTGNGVQPETVENVFLSLGEPYGVDLTLSAAAAIEEIVVTGERRDTGFEGSTTVFSADDIRRQPVIQRRIQEIVRQDPAVFVDLAEDSEQAQGISILGFNTRFNSLVVDGISQIDDFGITGNTGLPTRRSPISLDAVESIAVQKAPFSVENGRFQGGQINIVTKSGTNDFSGSAFVYYEGSSDLSGGRSGDTEFDQTNRAELTYGGSLGGPLIQDKLFFFLSYEKYEGPSVDFLDCPTGAGCESEDPNISLDLYNQLRQVSQDVYGYDPGGFDVAPGFADREVKYLGKLDWNIAEGHRASLTFQRTTSSEDSQPGQADGVAAPSSVSLDRDDVPQLYSLQLYSDWTDRFSTELRIGYKQQENGLTPLGDPNFATVIVDDLPGTQGSSIRLGPAVNAHNSFVDVERLQLKLKASYQIGDHTLTAGYERDSSDVRRIALDNSRGTFTFADPDGTGPLSGLDAFRSRRATSYTLSNLPLSRVAEDGAVDWQYASDTLYLQDSWNITDDLTLLAGLRYDRFSTDDSPDFSQSFFDREGLRNDATIDGRDVWSPRFAFTYQADDRTQIRGGAGIFAGGTPVTWLANAFLEDGTPLGNAAVARTGATAALAPAVLDNADPSTIPAALGTQLTQNVNASITLLDPEFDIPSQWRFNLGFDREMDFGPLGDGWLLSAEVTYSTSRDALQWRDLRIVEGQPLPDGRPNYVLPPASVDPRQGATVNDPPRDIILTNTSQGYSLAIQAGLEKSWETDYGDIDARIGYAWVDAQDVSPANDITSTRAVFRTGAYNDINDPDRGPGIQAVKHRGTWGLSWSEELIEGLRTGLSFFGEHRSSRPFSFTFNDPLASNAALTGPLAGLQRINPGIDNASRDRVLIYVPTGPDDPLVRYLPATSTVPGRRGASYEDLLPLLREFDLLERAGQTAERNSNRAPGVDLIDFKFTQDIPSPLDGHKAIFEFDIRNVLNFVDNDWGRVGQYDIRELPFEAFFDPVRNQYVYRNIATPDQIRSELNVRRASLWRARIGIRYQF